MKKSPIRILVAEDDPDDRLLIGDALEESRLCNHVEFVEDGEQLLAYLGNEAPFTDKVRYIRPSLILLDLNMPKMDGREVLREIKANPEYRKIPVVVLTTSKTEEDILRSYDLGVNSFITKPVSFERFVEVIRALGCYWLQIVELPGDEQ